MNLPIALTRARRMPKPEPLPEITETPRQAFLAGWWGGICCGCMVGAGGAVLLMKSIGKLV